MYLYFKVKVYEWLEQRKVQKFFYHHKPFKEVDLALLAAYKGKNPYRISREHLKVHSYGETPITTMAHIAQQCEITQKDHVIEMGAGRGRTSLFLAEYIGCQVIAYEQIPDFVKKMPSSQRLKTQHQDMFSADFSEATAIYLYGTMLNDAEIITLCDRFPEGTKIITVSYSLSDYSRHYVTKKNLTGKFPWGETEVYWNERIS